MPYEAEVQSLQHAEARLQAVAKQVAAVRAQLYRQEVDLKEVKTRLDNLRRAALEVGTLLHDVRTVL